MMQSETRSDIDYYSLFSRHVQNLTEHPGGELRGLCPFHDDKNPSWTGNRETGLWKCFGCGAQGNAYQFAERVGEILEMGKREIVAVYNYTDENGNLLFQVLRYKLPDGGKTFSQRRPDGRGGWITGRGCLNGVRRVLYRLPEILPKQTIFVVEGEKDTDRLRSLGLPATCNPHGAGNWKEEYSQTLRGKQVVILPDNDPKGEAHAWEVAHSLLGVAEAVKIVRLPGLPPHGDVSDWLDAWHTKEELAKVIKATPILKAEDLPAAQASLVNGPDRKANAPRVTLRHPSELVARPVSWRVEGILPDRMLTVLHALDKLGKTLLAWEIARAMLKNALLFGTFPVILGRVVLALLDDPHDLTVQRRDSLGLADCEALRIVTPLDADLSEPEKFLTDFKSACEAFAPQLIVVDALYLFAPPGRDSMNDAARMGRAMSVFDSLAETLPAAVLLIAHDRNDGTNVAGSHVIRAKAKALLHLTRARWGGDDEEDDGRRCLSVVTKMTGEARHLLRCQGVGAWTYIGRGDSAHQARTTWAQDRVLVWLKEGGVGTAEEIAKAVKIRKEDALTALATLEEDGKATSELRSPASGRGRPKRVYSLAGNENPKKKDGNENPEAQKSAPDEAQSDSIFVPPVWNLAGTKIDSIKTTTGADFGEGRKFCSQNPLSSAGNEFPDPRDVGGFNWQTGEQDSDWEEIE